MIIRKLNPDLEYVAAHYKLSPQSKQMAYIAMRASTTAAKIYKSIRTSIERELRGGYDLL